MIMRSVFHLDCTTIIPQCEFNCSGCLQEMRGVFDAMPGVIKFYTEGSGKEMKVVVEHDPSEVSVEQLLETFGALPSFYKGFFVAGLSKC